MPKHSSTVKRKQQPLKKVQICGPTADEKARFKTPPSFKRTTFQTSREMDFFSEKELVTQTGHDRDEWHLVFLKEAIDNALDACEEASVQPIITVTADGTGITVQDNGPGLPETTLRAALDFTVRASNREAYVAPDRGAQGNALKTLLAMPMVLDADYGKLIVTAHGIRHSIRCCADPISQRPVIHDDAVSVPTAGTALRIEWSELDEGCAWPFDAEGWPVEFGSAAANFKAMVEGFALFNPHATFHLDWFGKQTALEATSTAWDKWKPCKPTSAHWYEQKHLERLLCAYITHDRDAGQDRLVSDLLAEFDGLSRSGARTKVLTAAGLKRVKLSELLTASGQLDTTRVAKLLDAMQQHTRPVNPKRLGLIGEDHLRQRLLGMGVKPESFRYSKKLAKDGLPWILESAFGWMGDDAEDRRRIYAGANWSAAIKNPFRSFGNTGEGLETALAEMRATRSEPVVFVLHLAHPRVAYTDRGKSALVIGGAA